MNNEAPFTDVDHALKHAFSFEAKNILGATQYGDGSIRATDGRSVWDDFAQSGLTLQLASRTLIEPEREFMLANYTKPVGDLHGLIGRKELSCKLVSRSIYEEIDRWCDRWFINDIVRAYCGLSRQHNDKWWSNHLSVGERQLRRFKKGRGRKLGIIGICDQRYEALIRKLQIAFYDSGLIKYDN